MYVADHGESLGENNLYLHGLPYSVAPDVQKRVPWINWFSTGFASQRQISSHCLQEKADAPLSHDHYFHSVLGLMDAAITSLCALHDRAAKLNSRTGAIYIVKRSAMVTIDTDNRLCVIFAGQFRHDFGAGFNDVSAVS